MAPLTEPVTCGRAAARARVKSALEIVMR